MNRGSNSLPGNVPSAKVSVAFWGHVWLVIILVANVTLQMQSLTLVFGTFLGKEFTPLFIATQYELLKVLHK